MKNNKPILMLILLILTVFSAILYAGDDDKKNLKGDNIEIEVDGLSCPFCAYGLEKKLKALDSIDKLDIDINEGIIKISLKEGREVNEKDIKEKVTEAGFTLRKLIVDGKEYKLEEKESEQK
jgi:copper chaperone CopZ